LMSYVTSGLLHELDARGQVELGVRMRIGDRLLG
jgi:hypothetical protein